MLVKITTDTYIKSSRYINIRDRFWLFILSAGIVRVVKAGQDAQYQYDDDPPGLRVFLIDRIGNTRKQHKPGRQTEQDRYPGIQRYLETVRYLD